MDDGRQRRTWSSHFNVDQAEQRNDDDDDDDENAAAAAAATVAASLFVDFGR